MAELTKIELEVLAEIADIIERKIRILEMGTTDKDRLAYLTCLNDAEKIKYTRKEIAKLQKEFQKCSAEVSVYVFALIQEHPSDIGEDYYIKEKRIISNFVISDFHEVFELFAKEPKDIENWYQYFDQVIIENGFDSDLLSEFVVYMNKGSRYIGLTSFLPENNIQAPQPQKEKTKQKLSNETKSDFVKEIVEKATNLDIKVLKEEIESFTSSENGGKSIYEAIEMISNEYLRDFQALSFVILNNLDVLKKQSYPKYLKAFQYSYQEIIHVVRDVRFYDNETVQRDYYNMREKYPEMALITTIQRNIHQQVFKPLANELLLNRSQDFCKAYSLPESFNELKEYIVKGLYNIELYMDEKITEITYHNVPRAIEKINSQRFLYENNPKKSLTFMENLTDVIYNLHNRMEDSDFPNEEAWENKVFEEMYSDLRHLSGNLEVFFSEEEMKEIVPVTINILDLLETPEPLTKAPTSPKQKSFKYKKFANGQDCLNRVFKQLQTQNFIAKDTDLKDFKKIFSGEPIEKPIVWTGNKSELCYFIKQLTTEQSKVEDLKLKHWEVATICFVYPDNKPIDRDQLKGQKAPATAKIIETIVSVL